VKSPLPDSEAHLKRVRSICAALPGTEERLSHGEPTFFTGGRTFAMFANNHHHDGHIGVWIAAAPGVQQMLVGTRGDVFFRPPYVGVRGWVGVELERIDDEELASLLTDAWRLITPKRREGANRRG